MHDFGKLVYLDMHKSGSTLASKFLKSCSRLPERSEKKHAKLVLPPVKDVFYFTTIRNPLDLYRSLFRYGCDGKGEVYARLKDLGYGDLYHPQNAHFNSWLSFMLDGKELKRLYPEISSALDLGIGLMSIRHFSFSVSNPNKQLQRIRTLKDFTDTYVSRNVLSLIIKQEALQSGLLELAQNIHPDYFDQEKVAAFFADKDAARVNEAKSGDPNTLEPSAELNRVIEEKEFLVGQHYAPTDAKYLPHLSPLTGYNGPDAALNHKTAQIKAFFTDKEQRAIFASRVKNSAKSRGKSILN